MCARLDMFDDRKLLLITRVNISVVSGFSRSVRKSGTVNKIPSEIDSTQIRSESLAVELIFYEHKADFFFF